ncbi:hypothetical protein GCM10023189_52600 [Nibrella saemangeumensis]|uniref:DUF3618 domain-containing protein n=1 Tax=Nibrella saemangeumensis TaxID=1084526 RepID=A0ABP8NMY3_9BACT
MQDPNIPFADTSARRAQLQEATEQYKSSIEDNVQSLKGDAKEVGKTVAFVAGVGLAVYLIADAILPKSDEYRYAEKYGELDDEDYDEDDDDNDRNSYRTNFVGQQEESDAKHVTPKSNKQLTKEIKEQPKKSAIIGMVGGLVTSILTNLAKQQASEFLSRLRQNNATNASASSSTGYRGSSPASGYTNPY